MVYFGFDSATITSEAEAIVRVWANGLSVHVVIEGHTDERGSREYNLALGERCATC